MTAESLVLQEIQRDGIKREDTRKNSAYKTGGQEAVSSSLATRTKTEYPFRILRLFCFSTGGTRCGRLPEEDLVFLRRGFTSGRRDVWVD